MSIWTEPSIVAIFNECARYFREDTNMAAKKKPAKKGKKPNPFKKGKQTDGEKLDRGSKKKKPPRKK